MIDIGKMSICIALAMAIGGSAWGETLFYALCPLIPAFASGLR